MARTDRPRLYLIRHGETDANAEGRLISFTDAPLNATGREQAARLGAALADRRPDAIWSSPMARARQTAEAVCAAAGLEPNRIRVDERLRELDFGPYEGWSEAQLADDPVAAARRRDGAELPGMEPLASVVERARSLLDDLTEAGRTTFVFGHGRMLRILIGVALDRPGLDAQLRMRHCRPTILEPGERPLLLGFNVGLRLDEGPL
jgi:broad specificity phosphatase PhoE